jgi:AcrR family transcriptional regulator
MAVTALLSSIPPIPQRFEVPALPARPTKPKADPSESASAKPAKRREQQRAIETRQAILDAALSEFAEQGYEAASIRNIGARTGLQHPLITYHYRTKEILWKAVAENAFAEIRKLWEETTGDLESATPLEYLREKYFAFLRFTLRYPDFHHFMIRESRPGNPRLPWLVETILLPTLEHLLPAIRKAQAKGELPDGHPPVLIHYMLIGMTSVLSSLKDEIWQAARIKTSQAKVAESYLALLDATIFRPVGDPEIRSPRRRAKRRKTVHS